MTLGYRLALALFAAVPLLGIYSGLGMMASRHRVCYVHSYLLHSRWLTAVILLCCSCRLVPGRMAMAMAVIVSSMAVVVLFLLIWPFLVMAMMVSGLLSQFPGWCTSGSRVNANCALLLSAVIDGGDRTGDDWCLVTATLSTSKSLPSVWLVVLSIEWTLERRSSRSAMEEGCWVLLREEGGLTGVSIERVSGCGCSYSVTEAAKRSKRRWSDSSGSGPKPDVESVLDA